MIIVIDENKRIVSSLSGALSEKIVPNEKNVFRVESLPTLGAREELLFDPQTKSFEIRERAVQDLQTLENWRVSKLRRRKAEQTVREVLAWFDENDWKVNKRALGEWSEDDPRWIAYLSERLEKRAAYDEANEVLCRP
ncbi:MAG: hypothetical protein E7637_05720 [Ruminococcaceae bacterium]|nr:hypothetical protein [Oscillospiraceae bacterium]